MDRRVALVTGGARGIGAEIVRFLAKRGYDVAVHYNSSSADAKRLAEEVTRNGLRCELFGADFSKDEDVGSLIPMALERLGRLDLLVNNAAVFELASLARTDAEVYDRHFRVNLKAPVVLTTSFSNLCKKGLVINMVDAKMDYKGGSYFTYTLSKKALADFTKLASIELAPDIRVNAVAPGLITIPPGKDEAYMERLTLKTGIARGSVSDVTGAISAILDSDFTGEIVYADSRRLYLRNP